MDDHNLFAGFSDEKQAEYQKYAEEHWDKKLVQQSSQRWSALSNEGQKALMQEGSRITLDIARAVPLGPDSQKAQSLVAEWHNYINKFYDCSLEILLGLGDTYETHPEFHAFYRKVDPSLPEFLSEAIRIYCKDRGVTAAAN